MPLTDDDIAEIERWGRRLPLREVANRLGFFRSTVANKLAEAGIVPPRRCGRCGTLHYLTAEEVAQLENRRFFCDCPPNHKLTRSVERAQAAARFSEQLRLQRYMSANGAVRA